MYTVLQQERLLLGLLYEEQYIIKTNKVLLKLDRTNYNTITEKYEIKRMTEYANRKELLRRLC